MSITVNNFPATLISLFCFRMDVFFTPTYEIVVTKNKHDSEISLFVLECMFFFSLKNMKLWSEKISMTMRLGIQQDHISNVT